MFNIKKKKVIKDERVNDRQKILFTFQRQETAMGTKKQKEQREGFDYAMAVMK